MCSLEPLNGSICSSILTTIDYWEMTTEIFYAWSYILLKELSAIMFLSGSIKLIVTGWLPDGCIWVAALATCHTKVFPR